MFSLAPDYATPWIPIMQSGGSRFYNWVAPISCNYPPINHWNEVIEDIVILEAIVDLVQHSAIKVEMKGVITYREIRAKKIDQKSKSH